MRRNISHANRDGRITLVVFALLLAIGVLVPESLATAGPSPEHAQQQDELQLAQNQVELQLALNDENNKNDADGNDKNDADADEQTINSSKRSNQTTHVDPDAKRSQWVAAAEVIASAFLPDFWVDKAERYLGESVARWLRGVKWLAWWTVVV
ncbi:MAG: hypothetical protein N2C14_09615, partial [Planctomycetales bacterium]